MARRPRLALRLAPWRRPPSFRSGAARPLERRCDGEGKRRQVIGHAYAPTRGRQLTHYGIFIAVVLALFFGARFAVDELDKAPEKIENQAPWSKQGAPQIPPQRFE